MTDKNVLVIDDSPMVTRLVKAALSDEGYTVYSAEDGEEGLKIAEDILPSVILVDFIMPKMNGYQFCSTIRKDEHLKDTPVILITSKGEVAEQFAKKFDDLSFLVKPINTKELVEKVNALIELQKTKKTEPIAIAEPSNGGLETAESYPTERIQAAANAHHEAVAEIEKQIVSQASPDATSLPEIEKTVEKIVHRYFSEFSTMFQSGISDALKQTPVVITGIIFSGELSDLNIIDVVHLIEVSNLTGNLSIQSNNNYMIYFENGDIIYASLDKKKSVLEDANSIKEQAYEIMHALLTLDGGKFFFEKGPIPDELKNISLKLKPSNLIHEVVRRYAKKRS